MYLSDSHCHLHLMDLDEFSGSVDKIVEAATLSNVKYLCCVGTRLEDQKQILALIEKYPDVSASTGLHPNEEVEREPTEEEIVSLAADPKIVAIGETGLDYFRSTGDLSWQHQRFRTHIRAAKTIKKPLIIHTRQARADTIQILKKESASEVGGVFHCFTEDLHTAEAALDLGFYISFSGIVTFKNAVELQNVAKHIPLDRMLLETDSPYLAPIPHRGKANQPAFVKYVAEFIAELRCMKPEDLALKTTENYKKLFLKA